MIASLLLDKKNGLLFLILIALCCFDMLGVRSLVHLRWIYYVFFSYFIFNKYSSKFLYYKPLLLLLICIVINCTLSCINNDENLISYLNGESSIFLYYLFYFIFMQSKLNSQDLENVIVTLCFIFCIAYIIQVVVYPFAIFQGALIEYGEELRPRLTGQCMGTLAYFLGLNKILSKFSMKYAVLTLLGFIVTLYLGFRSQIAAMALVTIVLYIRLYRFRIKPLVKYLSIAIIVGLSALQVPIVQLKIDEMVSRNENANFDNDNYIRIVTYGYYTTKVSDSPTAFLFGLGLPGNDSKYQLSVNKLKKEHGIIWADWGLIGLSWMFGLIGTITIVLIALSTIFIKVPSKYLYISSFFLFMVLGSIMTREIYRVGSFVIQGFMLTLLSKCYGENKNRIKNEKNKSPICTPRIQ